MKQTVQRNLSITTTYEIVESYYRSIEDGGGCCANCGKVIANIAVVQDASGRKFDVGMDCAATLSGIRGGFSIEHIHMANFRSAQGVRRSLLKYVNKGTIKSLEFKTFEDEKNFYKEVGAGKWEVEFVSGGYNWKQYPAELWNRYVLPMIKDIKVK